MATISAGILMYRHSDDGLVVLLVHPGGPFWHNRDLGAWSIPKGELDDGEAAEAAGYISATSATHAQSLLRNAAGPYIRVIRDRVSRCCLPSDVRLSPKATEALLCSETMQWASRRHSALR